MSAGTRIEIIKEVGDPRGFVERFDLAAMAGSHGLGHTRMATESKVTTEGAHPFSTGLDLCLVHNGSLSNHNALRRRLRHEGIAFQTENDTEVAAGYLEWRLREGDTLQAALEACLVDLDGFYTFAVGTADGFAVLRDPIACKPAVMAENDDWVAMASEYRAIAVLPGADAAEVWEPEPARVYSWERERRRDGGRRGAIEARRPARTTPLRELNRRLHAADVAPRWRVAHPNGAHAVAVGIDAEIEVDVDGHVGYYCAGMNKRATVRVHGNAGVGLAENIMSGTVVVDGYAGQSCAATGRGGLVVVRGDASARCGISMKGVDIVVAGLGRAHERVHGAEGRARRLRRRRRGARRLDLRGAPVRARQRSPRSAPTASRRSCATSTSPSCATLLDARAACDAEPGEFRRYGSARRLYNFDVDNAGAY